MRSWRRSVADAPLSGIAVVVTRPEAQARTLALELEGLGARVARVPLVEIAEVEDEAALDAAGRALASYDWVVFTSANGVLGPATANALRESGTEPTFVGAGAAESIAAGLDSPEGARVLLLQADIAGPELADALRERGALVDAVTAYRTVGRVPTEAERQALDEADAIVLASGSAARSLAALEPAGAGALIACIGPKTASAAREVGLRVDLVADETTADGMIRALVEHYGEST
jgi:uroporphyrinogen-III synthase